MTKIIDDYYRAAPILAVLLVKIVKMCKLS